MCLVLPTLFCLSPLFVCDSRIRLRQQKGAFLDTAFNFDGASRKSVNFGSGLGMDWDELGDDKNSKKAARGSRVLSKSKK